MPEVKPLKLMDVGGGAGELREFGVSDTLPSANLPANVAALAGLAGAADKLPYFTGLGTFALATLGMLGRNLIGAASTEAMRTTLELGASSNPTFNSLTLPGGQITFPAEQVPSSGANTLDDYEEGTWTPLITFATPGNLSVSYINQTGVYNKIGRVVQLQFTVITSSFTHNTAAGNLLISGAPFSASTARGYGGQEWRGITKSGYTDVSARMNVGASAIDFVASASGLTPSNVSAADVPSGGTVDLRGFVSFSAQ